MAVKYSDDPAYAAECRERAERIESNNGRR